MKAIICILLVGYWIFGPTSSEHNNQIATRKEQIRISATGFHKLNQPNSRIVYLDAKGNIIEAK
jgi:hypothetical protein